MVDLFFIMVVAEIVDTESYFRNLLSTGETLGDDYRGYDPTLISPAEIFARDHKRTGSGHKTIYEGSPMYWYAYSKNMYFTRTGYFQTTHSESANKAFEESIDFLNKLKCSQGRQYNFLEIGTGMGGLTYPFAEQGHNVFTIENNEWAYRAAQHNLSKFEFRGQVEFYLGEADEFFNGMSTQKKLESVGFNHPINLVIVDLPWGGSQVKKFLDDYKWKDLGEYGIPLLDKIIAQGYPVMVKVPFKMSDEEIHAYGKGNVELLGQQTYNRPYRYNVLIHKHEVVVGERKFQEKLVFINRE